MGSSLQYQVVCVFMLVIGLLTAIPAILATVLALGTVLADQKKPAAAKGAGVALRLAIGVAPLALSATAIYGLGWGSATNWTPLWSAMGYSVACAAIGRVFFGKPAGPSVKL